MTLERRSFLKRSAVAAGAATWTLTGAPYHFVRNIATGAGRTHHQGRHPAFAERHDRHHRTFAAQRRAAGDRGDQRQGRRHRQAARAGDRGSAVDGAGVQREGQEAAARGQGGGRARLLHLRQPPVGAAGVRAAQWRAALSDPVRGPGVQQELLLHGRGAEPAARRFRAVDHQRARPQEILPDRRQLHLSQGDQSRGQGAAREVRRRNRRRGVCAARPHRILDQHQQDRGKRAAISCSPTSSATRSSPSTSSSGSSASRPRTSRSARRSPPSRRSRRWARRTRSATTPRSTTSSRSTRPRTSRSSSASRPSTARTRSPTR